MSDRRHSPTDDLRDLRAVHAAPDLSAHERSVMVALILHRNGDTGRCDPSVPGLAQETGLSRWSVMRAITELEDRGMVETDKRRGIRTTYTLHPPTSSSLLPVADSNPLHTATEPVADSNGTSSSLLPERTKNELRTNEGTSKPDPVSDLWAAYVEDMDGGRLTLTQGRRKVLRLLHHEQLQKQDDPVALFRKVLAAVKRSDHHMGNRAYQLPESLFRNPERRERWTLAALENGRGGRRDPTMLTQAELKQWNERGAEL